MVDFTLILNPWFTFSVLFGIIILLIIILTVIEIRFKRRVKSALEGETIYKQKISELRNLKGEPDKVLNQVDRIARSFFKEVFNMNTNMEYAEMSEKFKQKNKMEISGFCRQMLEALYSGQADRERVKGVIQKLSKIILKEEKEFIQKNFGFIKNKEDGKLQNLEKSILQKIEKVNIPLLKRQEETPKEIPQEEIKPIIQNSNEKKQEIKVTEVQKQEGVEEEPEPEIPRIVEPKKEKVSYRKTKAKKEEPETYKQIMSIDDLDRIKSKIKV